MVSCQLTSNEGAEKNEARKKMNSQLRKTHQSGRFRDISPTYFGGAACLQTVHDVIAGFFFQFFVFCFLFFGFRVVRSVRCNDTSTLWPTQATGTHTRAHTHAHTHTRTCTQTLTSTHKRTNAQGRTSTPGRTPCSTTLRTAAHPCSTHYASRRPAPMLCGWDGQD